MPPASPFPDAAGAVEITQAHPARHLDAAALEATLRRVIEGEGATLLYLSVVLGDHALVLDLNRQYLGHDYLTDVLSFDLGETEGVVDGELYIDLDTAAERHVEFGTSFEAEATRYAVHGLLHLLGYDDATPEEKAAMHRLEDVYLG